MITDLLDRLERERFETGAQYDAVELAWRKGWNARAESLLRELRVRIGLAEMAAYDVDGESE